MRVSNWNRVFFYAVLASGIGWMVLQNHYPVREISPIDADALIKNNHSLVIDVRSFEAYNRGHIPSAVMVPLETLAEHMKEFVAYRAQPIVVYCGDGVTRGAKATYELNQNGYAGAVNLKGGMGAWKKANLPVQSS